MKDLIAKHAELIDEHVGILQEEQGLVDMMGSVHRRIIELEAERKPENETDLFRARDKLRHTQERLTRTRQERTRIEGELAKLRFEADLA